MPELVIDGDRRMIVAGAFRLAFAWSGDRWSHSLEYRGRDGTSHRVLAVSVEGDPARDDPKRVVSPAYQDLQFQEDGPKVQALLVGQSGPHHFSAVFSVGDEWVQGVTGRDVIEPPFEVQIEVDIADRCRGPVEFLASTYIVDARSGELIEASPDLATWDADSGHLTLSPTFPARVSLAEAGRRATQVQAYAGPQPGSATHRLIYHWIWQQNLPL